MQQKFTNTKQKLDTLEKEKNTKSQTIINKKKKKLNQFVGSNNYLKCQ